MARRALIVDDSRTSRVILSRTLEGHDLDVDMAESAEAALEYLVDNRPDVIFMDHMMPGMDGFEAVAAIKKDPRTATIPIMMYTSKKGEVYVGQARALGAIGVLPKDIEPVEVSKILESLHIIGDQAGHADGGSSPTYEIDADTEASFANLDADIRIMLERLFDEQRLILKHDMQQTSDSIASKVADRIRPEELNEEPGRVDESHSGHWLLSGALGLATIVLASLFLKQGAELDAAIDDKQQSENTLQEIRNSATAPEDSIRGLLQREQQQTEATAQAAYSALEWGFNRGGHFPYGEEPLGDSQLDDFAALVEHLESLGFAGEIFVETHVGEHCLRLDAGSYVLAAPEQPASSCTVRGMSLEEGVQMSSRQSIAMTDFMLTTEARTGGAIRFVVSARGATNPVQRYPVGLPRATAGEWNAAADANNRVRVSLMPGSP